MPENENICHLLYELPPNTEVTSISLDGTTQAVTKFVAVKEGLAYFLNGAALVVANCHEISSVNFPTT